MAAKKKFSIKFPEQEISVSDGFLIEAVEESMDNLIDEYLRTPTSQKLFSYAIKKAVESMDLGKLAQTVIADSIRLKLGR